MKDEMPDVFIVPSQVIHDKFQKYLDKRQSRLRWHPKIEDAEPYKNYWDILREYLMSETLKNTGSLR